MHARPWWGVPFCIRAFHSHPCLLQAHRKPQSTSATPAKTNRPVGFSQPMPATHSLIKVLPSLGDPFSGLIPSLNKALHVAQEPVISLITPSFQRGFNLPEGVSLAYSGNVFRDDNWHLLECSTSLALGYTLDIQFLSRGNEEEELRRGQVLSSVAPTLSSASGAASASFTPEIRKRSEFLYSICGSSGPEMQNDCRALKGGLSSLASSWGRKICTPPPSSQLGARKAES